MQIDRAGLRVLTRSESLALLGTSDIGRIAISSRALPVILPVHYGVDGEQIVIATNAGTTLHRATANSVVAFETDGRTGSDHAQRWSVHVNGIARHVTEPTAIEHLKSLHLPEWGSDGRPQFVTISTDDVTGRASVNGDGRVATTAHDS
jgi:nitroimidazol reductase NimA-like FMN-containing flavoprotein (pyridoxamine 5'-phosphate oxidase superfamily)